MVRGESTAYLPLTFTAMTSIAVDIKFTFSAAITDLKVDILVLTEQLSSAEQAGRQREKANKWLEQVTVMHSQHFINISRH